MIKTSVSLGGVVHLPRLPKAGWVLLTGVLALAISGCGQATGRQAALSTMHHEGAPSTSTTKPGDGSPGPVAGSSVTTHPSGPSAALTPSTTLPTDAPARGEAPTVPGTYSYHQTGSMSVGVMSQSFPPTGTIVIEPPASSGEGAWTQMWRSFANTAQPSTDTTYAINSAGLWLVTQVQRETFGGQTVTYNCTFTPPIKVANPSPVTGYTFSGTGDCGSMTASITGQISGFHQTSFGGGLTTAYEVDTTVTTQGSVNSKTEETDWVDPMTGIDRYQSIKQSGTYNSFSFSSSLTRTLESTTPS